jgi:hypothetical protein
MQKYVALTKNTIYIVCNNINHICNTMQGVSMEKNFIVITEIYFKDEKISRSRVSKSELDSSERDQLIRTLFYVYQNQKIHAMDIYSKISLDLKEKFQIILSERSIMRAVKKL